MYEAALLSRNTNGIDRHPQVANASEGDVPLDRSAKPGPVDELGNSAPPGPLAVRAATESTNGTRFVCDTLTLRLEVEVADAQTVKRLGPVACKTDRIDGWVFGRALTRRSRTRNLAAAIRAAPSAQARRQAANWRPQTQLGQVPHARQAKRSVPAWPLTCPAAGAASCSRAWASPTRGATACWPRSQ